MTLLGLGMMIVFGFLAVRHFRNGRLFWAIPASIGCLLGAASLWVDYMRATSDGTAPATSATMASAPQTGPVIEDYDPSAR